MAERAAHTKRAPNGCPFRRRPTGAASASGCSTWYGRHGRDLPWRKTSDPYHILVSEIMLQQTQVDRVLPKYTEWLDKYPSIDVLAAAPEREVTETWYPLGYNIRPRRLQTIAREAVAKLRRRSSRPTKRRSSPSKASARTPPAPSAASRSGSARRFSTRTSHASCSGSSSPRGSEKPRDETALVGGVGDRSSRAPRCSISIRR